MPNIAPFGGLKLPNSLQGAGPNASSSASLPALGSLTGGSALSGLTSGGNPSLGGLSGVSGIGGGTPGLDTGSLQKMGVSGSTLMLMSQINSMMAGVMSGLTEFLQKAMASSAQRKQQKAAMPGMTPGGTPGVSTMSSIPTGAANSSSSSTKAASKSSGSGKGGLTPIGVGGGNSEGPYRLNSSAANAFQKANAEYRKKYGTDIPVLSAYRSEAYNRSIGGATNSNHIDGNAIDVNMGDWQKVKPIIEKYGFKQLGGTFNGKSEDNHFDFKG